MKNQTNAELLKIFGDMMAIKLSQATQESYWWHFQKFSEFKQGKQLYKFSSIDIREYSVWMNENKKSDSFFNQAINSIRFFFKHALNRAIKDYMVVRPKKAKTFPILLSDEELQKMFDVCDNLKHKAILCLALSAGLRVSEIVNLKIEDIDSPNMVIHVHNGKGKKQRMTVLDTDVLNLLREYYKQFHPKIWLFNGQIFNHESPDTIKHYSVGSIQKIVKHCAEKAGIAKKVWVHLLRHQFCTGVLECGGDIYDVAASAGHESLNTSRGYIHTSPKYIARIKSPISNIRLTTKILQLPA